MADLVTEKISLDGTNDIILRDGSALHSNDNLSDTAAEYVAVRGTSDSEFYGKKESWHLGMKWQGDYMEPRTNSSASSDGAYTGSNYDTAPLCSGSMKLTSSSSILSIRIPHGSRMEYYWNGDSVPSDLPDDIGDSGGHLTAEATNGSHTDTDGKRVYSNQIFLTCYKNNNDSTYWRARIENGAFLSNWSAYYHINGKDMGAFTESTGSSDVTDETDIVTSYADDTGYSSSHKGAFRRKASKLWNYIKGKLLSDTGTICNLSRYIETRDTSDSSWNGNSWKVRIHNNGDNFRLEQWDGSNWTLPALDNVTTGNCSIQHSVNVIGSSIKPTTFVALGQRITVPPNTLLEYTFDIIESTWGWDSTTMFTPPGVLNVYLATAQNASPLTSAVVPIIGPVELQYGSGTYRLVFNWTKCEKTLFWKNTTSSYVVIRLFGGGCSVRSNHGTVTPTIEETIRLHKYAEFTSV